MNFRYKLMRFMSGRYGMDALFYVLFGVAALLFVINLFVGSLIIQFLIDVVLVYAAYRVLSRNIYKRQRENQLVVGLGFKLKKYFDVKKQRKNDTTHVYKKCPRCRAVLRLPRKKGKHTTVCPKCKNKFKVYVFKA